LVAVREAVPGGRDELRAAGSGLAGGAEGGADAVPGGGGDGVWEPGQGGGDPVAVQGVTSRLPSTAAPIALPTSRVTSLTAELCSPPLLPTTSA